MTTESTEVKTEESAQTQASQCCELLAFSVVAGKYDGCEKNCKYAEDFATLDDAIAAYDTASDYPWCYLQYAGRVLEVYGKGFEIFES